MPPRCWQLPTPWRVPSSGGIMGILNATPDSFSDGGRFVSVEAALAHARRMVDDGAHIIDVGGESTRPGSVEVAPEEELRRTLPIIAALRDALPDTLLSIDTRHASVAAAALQAGVHIINDISGLADPAMRELCAAHACGIVLMHMQGTPATMQRAPHYDDAVAEVRDFFVRRLRLAEQAGIDPARICLDPGIGFGKSTLHNLTLIAHLEQLRCRNLPILIGLSRKRFLSELFSPPSLAKSSPLPTLALSLIASLHGADLHRVHDVQPLSHALAHHAHSGTQPQ